MSRRQYVPALALLLAMVPRAFAQPRNAESYAILAETLAVVTNESEVAGNVGVQRQSGGLSVGRNGLLAGIGVADAAAVRPAGIVSTFFANSVSFDPLRSTVGLLVSPVPPPVYVSEPLVLPDPFEPANFPPNFPVTCGTTSKLGALGEAFVLTPGDYASIRVARGGKATLQPGHYRICSLKVSRGDVEVAGPSTLDIRGTLIVGNYSTLIPFGNFSGEDLRINVEGNLVRVGVGSTLNGIVFAPHAQLKLGRQASATGRFVVARATGDKGYQVTPPPPPGLCGNGSPDAGETCDPPGTPQGPNGNGCRGDCTYAATA